MCGNEVLENPDKILDIDDFEKLFYCDYIKEMLPVGSRGVENELNDLLNDNRLKFKYENDISIDLKKSGGPSTSCIITLSRENLGKITDIIKKPINIIGTFRMP
jgi:hypothetical protein